MSQSAGLFSGHRACLGADVGRGEPPGEEAVFFKTPKEKKKKNIIFGGIFLVRWCYLELFGGFVWCIVQPKKFGRWSNFFWHQRIEFSKFPHFGWWNSPISVGEIVNFWVRKILLMKGILSLDFWYLVLFSYSFLSYENSRGLFECAFRLERCFPKRSRWVSGAEVKVKAYRIEILDWLVPISKRWKWVFPKIVVPPNHPF